MADKFFFDTYALVCLIQNNPNYAKFRESIILTTQFNLVELYYSVLKDYNEKTARDIYNKFKNCIVAVDDETIFKAMGFRLKIKRENPKSNISYVDCIGYQCAKANKIPFVTGDKEFEEIDDVEFVR